MSSSVRGRTRSRCGIYLSNLSLGSFTSSLVCVCEYEYVYEYVCVVSNWRKDVHWDTDKQRHTVFRVGVLLLRQTIRGGNQHGVLW